MKPKTKVHFTLSSEALAIINRRATSPNKRGDWLSSAIVAYDALLADDTPAETRQLIESLRRLFDPRISHIGQ